MRWGTINSQIHEYLPAAPRAHHTAIEIGDASMSAARALKLQMYMSHLLISTQF